MLRNLRAFYYPTRVAEALALLGEHQGKAAVVAGGTSLSIQEDTRIEAAVDITRLGLGFIKEDRVSLRLGATTTLEELVRSRKVQAFAGGILVRAAMVQPSHLMRNGMTVAGATLAVTPRVELPPALLALDAELVVQGKEERRIPVAEVLGQTKHRSLGRTELVTEVRIPREMGAWKGAFEVFQRTTSDPPIVTAVAVLSESGGKCAGARLVFAGLTRRPCRLPAAEQKLAGKKLTASHFEQAAKQAVGEVEVASDWRASREYRLHVAQVLLRRTLAACWGA